MSFSDVEHYANMIDGCEAINNGNYRSPNASYAFAVLKLHLGDGGVIAGQEGFLDTIKKGAKTVKEFFYSLVNAIWSWLTNSHEDFKMDKERQEQIKELANKKDSEYKEYIQSLKEIAKETLNGPLNEALEILEGLDKEELNEFLKEENKKLLTIFRNYDPTKNIKKMIAEVNSHYLSEDSTKDFIETTGHIKDALKTVTEVAKRTKFEITGRWEDKELEEKRREENRAILAASKIMKSYSRVYELVYKAVNSYINKISTLPLSS